MTTAEVQVESPGAARRPTLARLAGYFAWLGTVGFGGPITLTGRMQRDLVDGRRWFDVDEFLEGLALAQLAPGPLAAQLACYLGYLHSGVVGAAVAGVVFVLPSFLMVWAMAWTYVRFSGLPWVQEVFYGVGPAAIAVIAVAAVKLTRRVVGRDRLLWVIALVLAATTALSGQEMVWLVLGAGMLMLLVRGRPRIGGGPRCWGMFPLSLAWPALGLDASLLVFFMKASLFVFGSGLAIVPFLYAGVVREHNWLTEQQFIDAVAVAMITPGPVVIMVVFIGYLISGFEGACVAALGVFLPTYLVVILFAPCYRRYAKTPLLRSFVQGVTAAATGAIAGAAILLAERSLVDGPTILVAVGALVALRLGLPEVAVVVAGGMAGMLIRGMHRKNHVPHRSGFNRPRLRVPRKIVKSPWRVFSVDTFPSRAIMTKRSTFPPRQRLFGPRRYCS